MSLDEDARMAARESAAFGATELDARRATKLAARSKDARQAEARTDLYPGRCEHCQRLAIVGPECSRTMRAWDGKGVDPNRDRVLCAPCAEEHHAHWDEQWDSYYAGLL